MERRNIASNTMWRQRQSFENCEILTNATACFGVSDKYVYQISIEAVVSAT